MDRLTQAMRGTPQDDPTADMSPIDMLKLRQALAAQQTVSPEQRAANLATTGWDALSVIPGPANAIAAKDAWDGGGAAIDAFGEGRLGAGTLNAAAAGLSGLGAATGLPFGRLARAVAKDAPHMAYAIPAWHGSPHDFDKFDLSKVGTGEKEMTRYGRHFADRGWGHYFSDDRDVGDSYRRMMAGNGGKLYSVELDVEPKNLLHWDRPITEQSPEVRKALEGLGADIPDGATGGDLFKTLERAAGGDPQAASRRLSDAGIPGTQYYAHNDPAEYSTFQGRPFEKGVDASSGNPGDLQAKTALNFLDAAGGDVNKAMQNAVATADRVGWPDDVLNGVLNHLASGDIAMNPATRAHNYTISSDDLIKILGKE